MDAKLRHIERQAALGDAQAQARLRNMAGKSVPHYRSWKDVPEGLVALVLHGPACHRMSPRHHAAPPHATPKAMILRKGKKEPLPLWEPEQLARAASRNGWLTLGREVPDGAEPVVVLENYYSRKSYPVFGEWQTRPRAEPKRAIKPGKDMGFQALTAALVALDQYALRYRDRADAALARNATGRASAYRARRWEVYRVKERVLEQLRGAGHARHVEFQRFQGGFMVEVLAVQTDPRYEELHFRIPVRDRMGEFRGRRRNQQNIVVRQLDIDKMPATLKTSGEMRLRDAWATVLGYLGDTEVGEDEE